ncbi:MAG TPA: hypothetical protein VJN21_09345 [Candidatus Acidoferrales bacterium]|nr:hypothetical protein [Candidatus Acidoferrales bacterium]
MTLRLARVSSSPVLILFGAMFVLAPALAAQSAAPPAQQSAAPVATPPQTSTAPAQPATPSAAASPKYYVVPKGTQLPLVLHTAISTRGAHVGDRVYLETLYPIVIDSHILIPAGSYVDGEVTEVKRPGRVHGTAELGIKLDHLILPNAYDVDFNSTPRDADTGGNETVNNEGQVKGDSDKAGDAGTVIRDTGSGALIGAIAARSGEGAGVGAGIGAAAGLATVLLTRGPEAVLPRGTTLTVELNRPLYLLADKINFTSLGQSSILPGPEYRRPERRRVPY